MAETSNVDKPVSVSKWSKIRTFFKEITVEPVIPLYLFPIMLVYLPMQNFDLDKSCRVNLRMTDDVCDALLSRNQTMYTRAEENIVQKEVTTMVAWKNIVKGLVPTLLLIVIGAWSDKYNRRKVVIGLPLIGHIISMCGLLLCTYFFYQLPMEATGIFDTVPTSLTGGSSTFLLGIFSYVSSISTVETRTVKIGVAKILVDASTLLGAALGGILYRTIGLYGIFSGILLLIVCGIIYLVTAVKEKVTEDNNSTLRASRCEILKDFFNIKLAKPTFLVACKRRKNNFRARIIAVLILYVLTIGPVYGESSVLYLFARKRFNWNEVEFSIFQSSCLVVQLLGSLFAVSLFSKYLKLSDPVVGMICYIGKIFAVCIFASAKVPWVLIIGVIFDVFSATTIITVRSMGTKFVAEDEIGKLIALIGILETLMPLVCGFLYTVIYTATLDILPGAFYLIGGVMWIPCMSLLGWLYVQHKRDLKTAQVKEVEQTEDLALIQQTDRSN